MKTIEEKAIEWFKSQKIEEKARLNLQYEKDFLGRNLSDDMVCRAYIKGATEQKAIDEEVRLKKSDSMTQAEYDREVAFADWYNKNGKGTPTYSDAIEWARKKLLEEACEWLGNYLMEIGYPEDWLRDALNIRSGKERFRKAMEE